MNFKLVNIRLIQLWRELQSLGIIRALLIIFLGAAITVAFNMMFYSWLYGGIATAVFAVMLMSVHYGRMDKVFVNTHLENPYTVFLTEYLLFTLPFTLPVLFTPGRLLFFVMIAIVTLIPLMNSKFKRQRTLQFLGRFITINNFEWISGLRKNYMLLTISYLLALVFCWVKIFPLFLIWIISATITSFYTESESLQVLYQHNGNASSFLKQKMKTHSIFLLILIMPIALLNFLFNPDYWWIIMLITAVQVAVLNFAILFKYSVYEPSHKTDANSVINALVAMSGLIPFLLPLPVLMCLRNYFIAKDRKSTRLNSSHRT